MKTNLIRRTIIAGALSSILVVPSLAQAINVKTISAKDVEIIPISYKFDHWAQKYVERLSSKYDIKSVFEDKDLNALITPEDFQTLIQLTIDKEYDGIPSVMTREAVVYEMTKIWAEKTQNNLDTIATIKMLIYSDTDKIDGKYNHGITVAYMKNIAKGKDAGVFDPKAYVTYGEAAALASNTHMAIEEELKSDNQSIAAGKFEIRGSYEIKDDKVVLDFELMSHHTESKELMFGSGQQFEVTITNEAGEEVYKYSDNKFFTMALIYKNLNPGEAIKWQDEWNMTNKEGKKLTSGKYTAKINILVIPDENSEKVDESQLTTTIEFNL